MSNKVYDIINKIQRFLPTLGGFYLVLVAAWGLPYGDPINKTIVGLAGVLAVFLEIWTGVWKNKGNTIEVHNINADLEQIQKEVEEMNDENL